MEFDVDALKDDLTTRQPFVVSISIPTWFNDVNAPSGLVTYVGQSIDPVMLGNHKYNI